MENNLTSKEVFKAVSGMELRDFEVRPDGTYKMLFRKTINSKSGKEFSNYISLDFIQDEIEGLMNELFKGKVI